MISVCQLSLLFISLMHSSPLNNDLSGVSINNPLTLLSVFVSALFLLALNKSSLNKIFVYWFSLMRVPDLWFSIMHVNLAQYRVIVGIFNNQKISRNLRFEEFPTWKWLNNLFEYVSICSSLQFYICLCSLFFI